MARLSDAELRPDVVGEVDRLRRANRKTDKCMILRKISRTREDAGHLNENGRPFNPRGVKAMVEG